MLFSGAAISLGAGGRWTAPPSLSVHPPTPPSTSSSLPNSPSPGAHLHAYLSFCMAAHVFFCLSDRLSLPFYMLAVCVCVCPCVRVYVWLMVGCYTLTMLTRLLSVQQTVGGSWRPLTIVSPSCLSQCQ